MPRSELRPKNYKRIFLINTLLFIPLLVLFMWPYIVFCHLFSVPAEVYYPASLLFSLPFTLTILHGHVTLALGSAHRHLYYDWLEKRPLTYGLLFHRVFIGTRFRLVLLTLAVLVFVAAVWLK